MKPTRKFSEESLDEGGKVQRAFKHDNWQEAFAEILLSDEFSSFVFRRYLSLEYKNPTNFSAAEADLLKKAADSSFYREFGVPSVIEHSELTSADCQRKNNLALAFDFWREIENLRRTYFTISGVASRKKVDQNFILQSNP